MCGLALCNALLGARTNALGPGRIPLTSRSTLSLSTLHLLPSVTPTEAGDGVVLAYAIVPVWFTRFAVRARSKLGLTCECKTLGGGGGVALNTTLQVLSTLQGLTALQAFSSFLLFFRYIRDIRVNREPEGLRDL